MLQLISVIPGMVCCVMFLFKKNYPWALTVISEWCHCKPQESAVMVLVFNGRAIMMPLAVYRILVTGEKMHKAHRSTAEEQQC